MDSRWLGMLGVETAAFERGLRDLAQLDRSSRPSLSAGSCASAACSSTIRSSPRGTDLAWIEPARAPLPATVAGEVGVSMGAMRGQRRREGERRGWDGIGRHLFCLQPTLTAWTPDGMACLSVAAHRRSLPRLRHSKLGAALCATPSA
ncbi:hypothetical protein [Streptomyces sp. SA15]|uniref:hypothetical protein n=1 Tax=Streptomyces sp. SA15 TaxID=934019 RepID=UPI0011813E3A|nr:hypothetical protein [Streptomyces sp. SA15]